MKKIGLWLAVLSLWIGLPSAQAAGGGTQEVIFGFGSLNLGAGVSKSEFSLGYFYPFKDWLQIGGFFSTYSQAANDAGITTFDFLVGVEGNMGAISDGYFGELLIVVRKATTTPEVGSNGSGFGFAAYVGKRFVLAGPVRYRPNIGVMLLGGLSFQFVPVQFSFQF